MALFCVICCIKMPSLDPASGLDFLDLGCFAILPGTCYFFGIQNLVWSLACKYDLVKTYLYLLELDKLVAKS